MSDLTIDLQPGNGKHLYEQIYEYIKSEIRTGKLCRGEKLPSTRSLAQFHQISRSTVGLAYEQLASEGYIEARPWQGYFVCPVEELIDSGMEGVRSHGRNGQAEEVGQKEKYFCDFSPDAIDMTRFPYATWKRITRNILVDANSEMFASGSPKGDYTLRETIRSYLHSARGVNCSPEQIIIGAGNDYLLLLLEKILGRHVSMAMENPTYERACRIFDSFAWKISKIAMDENGMSVKELKESGVDVAYVMPSHQYPTGIVMPIGRRLELLKWASEGEGRYLIEDDYDSEFRFKGKPVPSLQASDRIGKVIYIGTFSKSIASAIRISYMVLPVPLLEIYEKRCFFYSTTVSRIDQRILNEFIEKGHFERHLNRMRKVYREKHDLLLNSLGELENDFTVSGADAGLHILLHDKKGRREKELLQKAAALGVKAYGLSGTAGSAAADGKDRGTVILGYAALSANQIAEGIGILKRAWK